MIPASRAYGPQPEPRPSRWPPAGIVAVGVAAGLGVVGLVWLLGRPLALLVLAFTFAQALAPVADRLERHVRRWAAVTLIYLALAALLVALGWFLYPAVVRESGQLAESLPKMVERLPEMIGRWINVSAGQIERAVTAAAAQFRSRIVDVPLATVSALFELLVFVFLSLYLLIAGPELKAFVLSCVPRRRRARAARLMTRTGQSMGGYFRGAAIDGAIIGALTGLALWIVGVPYAPVLAVLAAFGELIPYVGPVVAALPAVVIAALQSPTDAAIVAGVYLVLQQVDSHLILPNVMRSQTEVNPALVIVALAAGFAAGGVLGALTAIPLFSALRVLVVYAVAPALRRRARCNR